MRQRTILHTSPEVEQFETVAGFRVPLIGIKTPEGTTYNYRSPMRLFAKLFDSDGNEIPPQSSLIIGKQAPEEELPRYVRKIEYSPYYDLSESQQRDARFAASVFHEFGRGVTMIRNPESHLFILEVEAPVQVDLSQPRTRLELLVEESN